MYLPGESIAALATESVTMSGIRYWLMDVTPPGLARRMQSGSDESIRNVRAPGAVDGAQPLEILRRTGWTSIGRRSYLTDACRVASDRIRAMESGRTPAHQGTPLSPGDPSGAHLFGRGE